MSISSLPSDTVEKTSRIECTTSSSFSKPTAEELAALVSIMRNLADFCKIRVLTYDIRFGNLSMLVTVPPREQLMQCFQDEDGEPAGSGEQRLFKHLQLCYSESEIKQLGNDLAALRKRGEDTSGLLARYTSSIGNSSKFGAGIPREFTRWIKEHRPKTFKDLGGSVCFLGSNQLRITDHETLRDIASRLDLEAVNHDPDGTLNPRQHWCGYADAIRGDKDAQRGLLQLMGEESECGRLGIHTGYGRWLKGRSSTWSKRESPEKPPKHEKVLAQGEAGGAEQPNKLENIKLRERPLLTPLATEGAPAPEIADEPQSFEPMSPPASAAPQPAEEPMLIPDETSSQGRMVKLAIACVLLAVLAVSAAVVVVKLQQKKMAKRELARKDTIEALQLAAQAEEKMRQSKLAIVTHLLRGPEARKLADAFAASADTEERLSMCRFPDQVRMQLASYSSQALSAQPKKLASMGVFELGGQTFAMFQAKFTGGGTRFLCVVPTLDGLRVDWGCYARYCTATWSQIKNGVIRSAEVRVFAGPADYYNFSYKDEGQWICYQLGSPDMGQNIYAYVQRGSAAAKVLKNTFKMDGSQSSRFVLKISSSGESFKRRQFTIDSVKAVGWLVGEKDADSMVSGGLSSDKIEP